MPGPRDNACRLCLVLPRLADPAEFAPRFEAALAAGDVATVFIPVDGATPEAFQKKAELLVPIAQRHGAAAIVENDSRIAGRAKADGVHVDSGIADLTEAVENLRPKLIVGAGALTSRHDAMLAGELDPDYVFFGRLDGDYADEIGERALALATWWAGIFQIPAIVMGGKAIASVAEARDASIEFVALRSAVWDHPGGPAAAIAEATRILAGMEPTA